MNQTRYPHTLSWLLALVLMLSGCATVDTTTPNLTTADDIPSDTVPSDTVPSDTEVSIDATPTLVPEIETEILTDTTQLTDTAVVTETSAQTESTPAPVADAAATTVGPAMGLRNATGILMSVEELEGYPVENLNGEDLGEIDNLVINLSTGEILFANLAYGGFLDLGETIFPIPLNAFRWDPEFETMLLDIPEEALENAPGFDETWPDLAVPDWDVETGTFWRDLGIGTRGALGAQMANNAIIRSGELLGLNVQNTLGADVGDIQDLIVNLETGAVPYAVMGFGGFLGLGEDLFAVPLSELNATVNDIAGYGVAVGVDLTEEALQTAPRLPDDWEEFLDPDWDAELRTFWGLGDGAVAPAADTVVSAEATDSLGDNTGIEGIVTTALGPSAAAVFVSELLGQTVYDFDDNALGEINDAVVSLGSGDIAYLIITPTATDADAPIPLPVGVLSRSVEDQQLTLNADAEILAAAPRLPATDEDIVNGIGYFDAVVEQEIYDYWAATGAPVVGIYPSALGTTTDTVAGLPPLALEVSNMVGRAIVNRDLEEVGTLDDAIYEANAIRYAVLSLPEEDGMTVIPLYALLYDVQNGRFILDVSIEELTAAPGFTTADELDLQSVDWSTGVNDYWDTQVGLIGQLGVRVLASTTLLADNILGDDVVGANQEDLGDIEDLIIDSTSGQVRYAVISFGGFLGLGENYFAIPLDQLIIDPYAGGFSTALTADALEGAPSFAANAWPDLTTPDWDADFRTFWADEADVTPTNVASAQTTQTVGAVRATALLDTSIVDATGNNLGEVENLLVDFFRSQVSYYVLEIGGFLDIGDREIVVPWNAPALAPAENALLLDVTEEMVENAPEFDAAVWPTVANPGLLLDADTYWAE